MDSVDDIGVLFASDDKGHRPILACSWSPGAAASGWVGLDTWITSGRTEFSFVVYDRQVSGFSSFFTAGKWTFNANLSDKDGSLWNNSGAGVTSSGAVKYSRRFVFRRGDDGVIRLLPSTDIYDELDMNSLVEQFEDSMVRKGGTWTDFMGDSVNFRNIGNCN